MTGRSRAPAGVLALLFTATVGGACGSSNPSTDPMAPPATPPPPRIVDLIDGANHGNGRDLRIRFVWSSGDVSGFEVVVVEASAGVTEPAAGVSSTSLPGAQGPVWSPEGLEFVTSTGATLEEDVPYAVFIRARFADGETTAYSSAATVILRDAPFIRTLATIQAGTGGMAVDAGGLVYMGDFGPQLSGGPQGRHVYRITPSGAVDVFASGLQSASGNAFASNGDLFQSNIGGNTVSRITPEGGVTTFVSSGLSGPVGIAIDGGDTLYVANCGDHTIQKVAPDGTSSRFSSSSLLSCPNGIALADDGHLYVANFFDGNLLRVEPDGTASVFVTFGTNNLGHVTFANGVLYVAVRGAHQIAEVTLDGGVRILAGTGERGGRDGTALEGRLSFPNDIAVSPDGRTLYFNDVDPETVNANVISPAVVRALELGPRR